MQSVGMMLWLCVVLLPALGQWHVARAVLCAKRVANESFVCVCNSTYCDTIPEINDFSPDMLYLYSSSRDGLPFTLSEFSITAHFPPGDNVLVVIPRPLQVYQSVLGFGGAFTDSAVFNILSLPRGAQENLLEAYFSPNGLGYTLGRVPIACTDFSLRPYSYDGMPGDYALNFFSLTTEDINGKIPTIRRAQEVAGRALDLVAGAWVAPAWMKNDNKILSSGNIRTSAYDAFARYHVKFLEAYAEAGLDFWAVTNGNEPIDAIVSTQWPRSQMALWIARYLGPALNASFSQVRLLLLDDLPERAQDYVPILADASSGQYISGWAIHPYSDVAIIAPSLDPLHAKFPEKLILQTEYSVGIKPEPSVVLGSWQRAESYATRIIQSLNHWSIGWLDWNLAVDARGGPTYVGNFIDGAIVVNGSEFYKQPAFYVQGHFSRFIRPGARRVGVSVGEAGLGTASQGLISATAAANADGRVAVVLLNRLLCKLRGLEQMDICVRTAPASHACFALPAKSISTALYQAP